MKTIKLLRIGLLLLFASYTAQAQVSINVNLDIQPSWGPAGYSSVSYYYIPDIQCYYDVRATQFIYLNNGVWIRSRNLPSHHRHYDLNKGYKVVLNNYHGSRPYTNYRYDKVKYYKGYKGKPQKNRGVQNRDNANNHRQHEDRESRESHGKGHGKGHGNESGKGNKHGH